MRIACIVPGSYIQIWDKKGISGPQNADDMFLGRLSSISKKYAKEFYDESYCNSFSRPPPADLTPSSILSAPTHE
ncbi:protein of unknown function [Methanoculleus bourgensis]|uniref:Uncharacterized protein n=1 Tax=Methanoculleus bourgensis TaxID=83986 RepID=A0A0X3BJM1_9EURY|nr:protein of unknown function [Methanoculleus bourgensis]